MICEVILCRKDGRRLRESEWAQPVRGRLEVINMPAEKNSFKRNVRAAQLMGPSGAFHNSETNVVPPLFDPQILPAPRGKLLIRGIELAVVEKEIYEHEQLWLCTPTQCE